MTIDDDKGRAKDDFGQRREMEQVVVEQVSPALSGLCSHQNMSDLLNEE